MNHADLTQQPFRYQKSSPELDDQGGVVPQSPERARLADLLTLPPDVPGTNCGNCEFRGGGGEVFPCNHRRVQMPVTARMCCSFWSAPEVIRAWKKES